MILRTQRIFRQYDMEEKKIYKDDRLNKMKAFNFSLRKSLACISHQKYETAKDCFEEAATTGLEAVIDNNQIYMKEVFQTYHKFYTAFRKIKYDEGAKWCLLDAITCLRRLKIPKTNKTQIMVEIVKKYEASGGDIGDVKARWQNIN